MFQINPDKTGENISKCWKQLFCNWIGFCLFIRCRIDKNYQPFDYSQLIDRQRLFIFENRFQHRSYHYSNSRCKINNLFLCDIFDEIIQKLVRFEKFSFGQLKYHGLKSTSSLKLTDSDPFWSRQSIYLRFLLGFLIRLSTNNWLSTFNLIIKFSHLDRICKIFEIWFFLSWLDSSSFSSFPKVSKL